MPGSVGLNAPSYLPALVGSRLQSNSLLASLSGRTGPTPGPNDGADLALAGTRAPADADLQVERDIARFTQALAAANTPAQLLANPVALKVLLTSHGLADQSDNGTLAMRALLSNPARANSLLNQLKDPRWRAMNNSYLFATQGLAVLRNPEAVAAVARSYASALNS